jgi:hypothetical protein
MRQFCSLLRSQLGLTRRANSCRRPRRLDCADWHAVQPDSEGCKLFDWRGLTSAEAEASDKSHVLGALGKAASEIRNKLGESRSTVQKFDTPLELATCFRCARRSRSRNERPVVLPFPRKPKYSNWGRSANSQLPGHKVSWSLRYSR